MAKKHRGRRRHPPGGGRPHTRSRAPRLTADAEQRLRQPTPFELMTMASPLIEVATPRPADAWPGSKRERTDGPTTFLMFAESPSPAMQALALAVAAMHPDKELAAQLRAAVDTAPLFAGPRWLRSMDSIELAGVWLQTDVLGDGENIVLSWRWPDGGDASALVYVDHNMGTVVKDAFVVPEAGNRLLATYADLQPDTMTTVPLDPAVARARIEQAIADGDRTVPPLETDSWPACRPMVEWILCLLPEGGTGYKRPDWPAADRERLLDDFLASPHAGAAGLDPADVRDLAEPLVWFGCDYGPGDPLRWSPVSVEIVMADWYPRKVFGLPDDVLERLPDVLVGFVRFAHERLSIPAQMTVETVDSVARWRRAFADETTRPGRTPFSHAMEIAGVAAGFDPDAFDDGDADWPADELGEGLLPPGFIEEVEAQAIELVGGTDAYANLTDEPLADVTFDWDRVPATLRPPTEETLVHLDRWATELFDDEVRTIARAVLAAVVDADPSVFKRSSRTDGLAAAILGFLLLRLTGRLKPAERRGLGWAAVTLKAIAEATGVAASSVASRSRTIANVVERADLDWPSILHSSQRAETLRLKENIADWRQSGHQP